jgi:hypothetical protein
VAWPWYPNYANLLAVLLIFALGLAQLGNVKRAGVGSRHPENGDELLSGLGPDRLESVFA